MMSGNRLPYPGLRAFTREESDLFFGRENCVDSMVDRLTATRFLAVLGPSGGGKSSLVRTGLLDALELGLHPAGSLWQVADLHPGGQPLRNLAVALLDTRGFSPEPVDIDLLSDFLSRGPRSLAEWASGGNLKEGANLLILVDQFEELFRYGDYAQREKAEAFVALLLESASVLGAPIHIVITMRSEYLGACTLIPGLAEQINAGLYLTPRMSREECRAAIEGPAGVIGFRVSPALVTRLLNDLASFAPWESDPTATQLEQLARRADQLPLMQHVLNRLWARAIQEADGTGVELRLSDYEQVGGLSGALDAHGAEILARLSAEQAQYVETVFRALVSGPSVALAVRRPSRLGELAELIGNKTNVSALIAIFSASNCNFLRISEQSLIGDGVIVDISHESLIRQWTPLTRWLEKEIRDANEWRRLVAAQERYGLGEGGLLTGLDLHNLEAWWDSAHPSAAWAARYGGNFENVQSFLDDSLQAERMRAEDLNRQEIRETKRLRLFVAGLTTALVIATGFGLYAWKETREAKKNAEGTAKLLEQVSTVLYSDRYSSLLGIDRLQKELIDRLVKFQDEVDRRQPTEISPNSIAHRYRLAIASSSAGDATTAMNNYSSAYRRGLEGLSMKTTRKYSPAFMANLINVGTDYSWFLFDIGRLNEATDIMNKMIRLAGRYDPRSTPTELALAYGNLENLESRYDSDHNRSADANQHILRAINMLRPAVDKPDAAMEAMSLQVTLYGNVEGNEQDHLRDEICKLSDRMNQRNPIDKRAIRARVSCLLGLAQRAYAKNNEVEANANYRKSFDTIENILKFAPEDQGLLLSRTEIENSIANLEISQSGTEDDRNQLKIRAGEDFIRALQGKTLLQHSTGQVKNLYNGFKDSTFQNQAEELSFYKRIMEAVGTTLRAFRAAPDFAYVAGDAADRVGMLLSKDPDRYREAIDYLSKATDFFDRSRVIEDRSGFSEEFATYCGSYSHLTEIYAKSGLVEPMLRSVEKMKLSCLPLIEKYPFDMYTRNSVIKGNGLVGASLFKLQRYREALPYLEYASHWAHRASSILLTRVYREGLGVPRDEKKALSLETLAGKQSMERFTLTANFNGIKAPFYFYAIEWPTEYPFQGVDDQLQWLKVARGGTIPPEVAEAFRKLQKIARENNVSFPGLCVYALGTSTQKQPGARGGQAPPK